MGVSVATGSSLIEPCGMLALVSRRMRCASITFRTCGPSGLGMTRAGGVRGHHRLDVADEIVAAERIDAHPDRLRMRLLQELAHEAARLAAVLRRDGILKVEDQRIGGRGLRFGKLLLAVGGHEEEGAQDHALRLRSADTSDQSPNKPATLPIATRTTRALVSMLRPTVHMWPKQTSNGNATFGNNAVKAVANRKIARTRRSERTIMGVWLFSVPRLVFFAMPHFAVSGAPLRSDRSRLGAPAVVPLRARRGPSKPCSGWP